MKTNIILVTEISIITCISKGRITTKIAEINFRDQLDVLHVDTSILMFYK